MSREELWSLAGALCGLYFLSVLVGATALRGGLKLYRRVTRGSTHRRRIEPPNLLRAVVYMFPIMLTIAVLPVLLVTFLILAGAPQHDLTDQIMLGMICFPVCFLATNQEFMWFFGHSFRRTLPVTACVWAMLLVSLPLVGLLVNVISKLATLVMK